MGARGHIRFSWLAGLLLLVIAVATGVLFHSLETDRKAEQLRQERFMRNAALQVVDDLGAELFTMYSAFSLDLFARRDSGASIDKAALVAAIHRYKAQARFPDLLQELVCLAPDGKGGFTFSLWTAWGWVDERCPPWAESLSRYLPNGDDPPREPPLQEAFSLERPVLTMSLRTRHPKKGDVIAVALRFSTATVLEQVVPTLVRQRFSESQEALPYKASVKNLGAPTKDPFPRADWQVPLLPWTPFEGWFDYYVNRLSTMDRSRLAYERGGPSLPSDPSGTGWALTVLRLPDGIKAEMDGLLIRNVALSLGFFLVLILGFLGLDAAARRAKALAQQERTFLALISHELKTPLAVVRALADNLARGIGTDEARAREYGQVLQEEAERLGQMVGNVLSLTAIQSGVSVRDRAPVDLAVLVKDRLARQPSVPDLEVVLTIQPGLGTVQGHAAALSAAVDNLIGNAFRHGVVGPGPHRVAIRLESRQHWWTRGQALVVEDNGPGFTRAESRAFRRPFRRGNRAQDAQTPGGGVGLSLARVTAEALGGWLRWSAQVGRGAKFILWLRETKR